MDDEMTTPRTPPRRPTRIPWWWLGVAFLVMAIAGGTGAFVIATSIEAGNDAENSRRAATAAQDLLNEVRAQQDRERERLWRTQATLCEMHAVLGLEPSGEEDSCSVPEVVNRMDDDTERGRARLACLISAAVNGTASDQCDSDLDPGE